MDKKELRDIDAWWQEQLISLNNNIWNNIQEEEDAKLTESEKIKLAINQHQVVRTRIINQVLKMIKTRQRILICIAIISSVMIISSFIFLCMTMSNIAGLLR